MPFRVTILHMKSVVVLGASTNPDRYASKAMKGDRSRQRE